MLTKSRMVDGLLCALFLSAGSTAEAQECLGLASQTIVARSFTTLGGAEGDLRQIGGRYTLNGRRAFGGLEAEYIRQASGSAHGGSIGANLGYEIRLPAQLSICSVGRATYQQGPTVLSGANSLTTSLGLSAGRSYTLSPSFALVPYVHGALVYRDPTEHPLFQVNPTSLPVRSPGEPTRFGEIGAGLGFRVNDRLTVRPAFSRPIGLGRSPNGQFDTVYSLSLSWGFRRR